MLYETQIDLEKEMTEVGLERYNKELNEARAHNRESNTIHGITLMKEAVDVVADGIREFLEEALSGKPGERQASATLLILLDPNVCSYITLKYVIDGVSTRNQMTGVAMRIASAIEDQFKFDLWKNKDPGLFHRVKEAASRKTANRAVKRYNIIRTMTYLDVLEHSPWTNLEKMHLGTKLIDILISKTGLVEVKTIQYGRNKRVLFIQPNDATLAWIEEVNKRGEVLHPYWYPCVIPPRDWTDVTNGGYHSKHVRRLSLIKTRNKNYLMEMAAHHMPEELKAVNALQRTRWKVNERLLDVLKTCWNSGDTWANLPPRDGYKLLPSPVHGKSKEEMTDEEKEKLIEWKRKATVVYSLNAKMGSKRIQLVRTISMAEKFKEFEAIHFVYQCDFRGRKYTVNSFLTPQGPDYAKALLEFADKKPIDTDGAEYYFAVHGANCYGYDKVSFDARVAWVKEHTEKIRASASDPYNNRWWTTASDPWSFLAWCFEWAEYSEQGRGYLSSIPVSLDGSNNGLQHFSAMLRDPIGARATNLTPEEEPQDIYAVVAKEALTSVEADANVGNELAIKWLEFGIDRKITKRPVMVVPYGGTRYSCREYIEDAIVERSFAEGLSIFKDDSYEASLYLSAHVWDAISSVVVAARQAMDWLQKLGRKLSEKNIPVVWYTPSGFAVQQIYREVKPHRVTTHIDGVLYRPTVVDELPDIDKRKAASGVSPNFVHSMDASALTLTINKCLTDSITDFAVVHDSYGVHATHVERMAENIRKAFFQMYNGKDVLYDLYESYEHLIPDLPEPPSTGTLDLSGVLQSKYFFS